MNLPTRADIRAVIEFLPQIEQPGFDYGKWELPEGTLGYFTYSDAALAFFRAFAKHNFVYVFDWMSWEEGRRLMGSEQRIMAADLETLVRLVTMHLRADRFSEGHLAHCFEIGEFVWILRRLRQIAEEGAG